MDNYNQNQSQNGYTDNAYPNSPYPDNTNPWAADPFGQPQPPRQPVVIDTMANKKSQLATTSLVLGILGIVFCWTLIIPIIMGLIGLIMGIMSLSKTTENSGVAVAGTITSGVGLALNIAVTLLYVFVFILQ